jgi:hypothetical protein
MNLDDVDSFLEKAWRHLVKLNVGSDISFSPKRALNVVPSLRPAGT